MCMILFHQVIYFTLFFITFLSLTHSLQLYNIDMHQYLSQQWQLQHQSHTVSTAMESVCFARIAFLLQRHIVRFAENVLMALLLKRSIRNSILNASNARTVQRKSNRNLVCFVKRCSLYFCLDFLFCFKCSIFQN